MSDKKLILVTGATGYIASRLIPELLDRGYRVRCMVRQPLRLQTRTWFPYVEVISSDIMDPSTLTQAVEGVDTAYYLIHNMASGDGYTSREIEAAQNFASAAGKANLEHIIYLGGLADPKEQLPSHMQSRILTGDTLRNGKTPVTEFRAGVIVGPGSISFEMIRFMTELMPVIFGPTWIKNLSQPIATQNVLDYLLAALENTLGQGRIFEIGGPDRMSYADLMLSYGEIRGLRRKSVSMPGIPLWFMALGIALMTPVPAKIARPLVDGMGSHSLVKNKSAQQVFPTIRLTGYADAVRTALQQLHPGKLEPIWRDCTQASKSIKHEGFFIDHRCREVNTAPENIFQTLLQMGGKSGWPYANWLWTLRGRIDQIFGGPGLRGRKDNLKPGEVVSYYRVEAIEDNQLLRLRSELKAPGDGWMEWRIEHIGKGILLSQTGFFAPRGFLGFVYWFALSPFHMLVFRGLIQAIARKSED